MRKPLGYLDDADKAEFYKHVRTRHVGRCGTCKYFDPYEEPVWPDAGHIQLIEKIRGETASVADAHWTGVCRRYPPQPCYEGKVEPGSYFPEVEYEGWCGEWRAADAVPPAEGTKGGG